MTDRPPRLPLAWYDKRQRQWAMQLTADPVTYWRDEAGAVRYFLTAQDAYDAHAATIQRHPQVDWTDPETGQHHYR